MAGGKGTSSGSGWHTGHGRYGGTSGSQKGYDLNEDEDGGGGPDIDMSSCYGRPENPLKVSREKHNTKSYDKMRDRNDILRDLYASYEEGGVHSDYLTVQILLDIRDILKGER